MLSSVEGKGRAQRPAHHTSTELSMTAFFNDSPFMDYYP
ncbi:hypothetical protein HDF22_005735 [Mucilaginibacter lappiensis]|uniref:Uncharacterized protein n=1 Tax=Mucilaginibacter lappiensis TaxID=354630 RepID=A0A841JMB4_9SPHI|nr:hypothetical protein [Mucilaginibacter lappiensis]